MLNKRPRSGSGTPKPKLFSGKVPIGQPALSLLAPVDAVAPWFDFDVPAEITLNDSIEVQYGTSATFAGATSVVTTLTAAQASHCTLDLAQAALTNATTYYFRARYTIRGVTGPWSQTQSYAVATTSLPSTPVSCGNDYYNSSVAFDTQMPYGRDFDFGPADATRQIIVGVGLQMSTAATLGAWVVTDKDVAAGSVGTALTLQKANTLTSQRDSAMLTGTVTSGRSGRIAVSGPGNVQKVGICCARFYGASPTPSITDGTNYSTPADNYNIGAAQTIGAGGFGVAVYYSDANANYSTRSWKNGYSELTVTPANGFWTSMAVCTTTGSIQAAIARGNFQGGCGVLGIW